MPVQPSDEDFPETEPRTSGSDLERFAEDSVSSSGLAVAQGSLYFSAVEAGGEGRRRGKKLGVGAWFLFSGGSDDDNVADDKPTQTATNPAPTSSAPPKDDLEIAQLPGATSERTDITSFEDVVAHQVLTGTAATLLPKLLDD